VIQEKPVKKDLVGILERAQIDVSLQVVVLSLVGLVSADDLLFKALDVRREEAVQAKLASFLVRESCAFVQPLAVEEIHPARRIRKI
jgi:hypothetical protein